MTNEELILGYFKRTLSEEQQKRVEALLKEDEDFIAEFEGHKALHQAFKINEAEVLKDQLKAIESQKATVSKNPKVFFKYAIAAVIVAVLGISLFFNFNTQSFYKDYYQSYPNVYQPVVRGDSDTMTKGFTYYENKEYTLAQQEFELRLNEQYDPNVAYYYGLSLLETEDFEKALQQFENIKGENFQFKEELLWYSALAYIKLESYQKARKQLTRLTKNTSSMYYENSIDILDNLPNE